MAEYRWRAEARCVCVVIARARSSVVACVSLLVLVPCVAVLCRVLYSIIQ